MAREENLIVQAEGGDAYLVIHRDHERERTRHKVHVGDRTCTCTHWMEHLLPCMHIIVVVDKLELRTTPELVTLGMCPGFVSYTSILRV